MNLIDSSAWIEYLVDSDRASLFSAAIEDTENLIVPTICLIEVYKVVHRKMGEEKATLSTDAMSCGKIIDLTKDIAQKAAMLGIEKKLPMADSIILATARNYGAVLWTQDADFKGIEGVNYFPK